MNKYNLGFIDDDVIFNHVRNTVLQYTRAINLKTFNKNLIDPIKMTFDAKVYGQTIAEAIEAECMRQIDKANNNRIGYFHQNLFRFAGTDWQVPDNGKKGGFDIVNDEHHIYVELKNKHNTMNSASASNTYIKMQHKILEDDKAVCMLVEVLAMKSGNNVWTLTVDENGLKRRYSNNRIRRVSMDLFYEIVFGDKYAFFKLCKVLPLILEDVLECEPSIKLVNTVYDELDKKDFYKSLYALAFSTYEGFDRF